MDFLDPKFWVQLKNRGGTLAFRNFSRIWSHWGCIPQGNFRTGEDTSATNARWRKRIFTFSGR